MAANEELNNLFTDLNSESISTLDQLYEIQAKNAPSNVFLPFKENIYDIDLNTRTIYGPDTLSNRRDHKAEVIYFKIDRYFNYIDLSNMICVIQYIVPSEIIPRVYIVPYFDTMTCGKENKMLFPWVVGGKVTEQAGTVEYSVRFYKVQRENNDIKLIYNLSTNPTKSKITPSLQGDGEIMNAEYDSYIGAQWEDLISQVMAHQTTWTIL